MAETTFIVGTTLNNNYNNCNNYNNYNNSVDRE